MASETTKRKYDHIITEIHNDWCRENGYPVRPCPTRGRPKLQASSSKLRKVQATSFKPQATRFKLQATSNKLTDHGPFIKFQGA